MLKRYRFGLDWKGLVLFLVSMISTFVWLVVPAPNDVLRTPSVTPIVDAIGMILQVICVATLCFVVRKDTIRTHLIPAATSVLCIILYYNGWVAYYLDKTNPTVILRLTLPSCLAFIFYTISRRNMLAVIPAVGFTICHLIYGT